MLHNVGKNPSRGDPEPNTHDTTSDTDRMAHQTLSTSYASPGTKNIQRTVFKNNLLITYDDQNRIIGVYGIVSQVAPYPILITAQYGYDVFTDVLGISKPAGL